MNLGSTSKSKAGKYRIRYTSDKSQQPGLQLCSHITRKRATELNCDGLEGIITAVTPYGSSQPRYAVTGASDDLDKIHAFQDQSKIYTVAKPQPDNAANKNEIPKLTMALLNSTLSSDMAVKVMQLTARIAPYNPARNGSDQARVDRNLKAAGIDNGKYKHQPGQDLQCSFNATKVKMVAVSKSKKNSMDLGHEWSTLRSSVQGDFGTNYLVRQTVATAGYLQLTQSEALYPTYTGESSMRLNESQAYLFTFESKPPLKELGFWSLTAYNAEHFLIENDLNVYSLGDRSNLTYSDGTLVYGNDEHEDVPFQILVQPANVQPPKNWTSK